MIVPHNRWSNRPEYASAVARVLESGMVGQGEEVAEFERELAARFRPGGAAAFVTSGTAALHLAIRVLGIPRLRDDSSALLIPTYACGALGDACDMAGVKWFPVDEGEDADVIVHTYGRPNRAAKGTNIEDFTHAPGASIGDRVCGSFAKASVISFGATKPLGVGAGGAVLGDADFIADVKAVRDYDNDRKAWLTRGRFNWMASNIHAALGRARLRSLDSDNAWRRDVAALYCATLGHAMCSHSDMQVPYRYTIGVADTERTIAKMAEAGVEAINPLRPDELLHRRRSLPRGMFPLAEKIATRLVSVPIWPGMTDAQVNTVRAALESI